MMRTRVLALVLAVTCGSCVIGPKAEDHVTPQAPGGRLVTLQLPRVQVKDSELLMVQDSALLVQLSEGGLASIHFADLRSIEIEGFRATMTNGRPPSPKERQGWMALSRFPQGLRPDQLARLLEASGQSAVERIQ